MGDMSQLPEDIIHHILSYITTTEAYQVSIFCKTWYNAWLTCPTLNFIHNYVGENGKYFKFFNKTLLRYQEQKIPIVRLNLRVCSSPSHVKWIRVAVQNGVKRLDLGFKFSYWKDQHTLLRTISEAGSLRELSLGGKIRQLDGRVIFNHLSTLNLRDIHNIYDDRFQAIIAKCPFIENLCVEDCEGLKSIKVCTLYKLKKFTVRAARVARYNNNVDVEIRAPNLQFLQVEIFGGSLKLYNTKNLIGLTLVGKINLPSTFLDNWEYKYPQIENLYLLGLKGHGRMIISSPSLKRIVLKNLKQVNIEIEAPNLQLLHVKLHSGSLKLYNTEKLLCLSLVGNIDLPSTFLDNWEQEFPQVENLDLFLEGHKRMSILSHSLKQIVLNCEDLREVYIGAPNLVSLELRGVKVFPELSLADTQTQMMLKIFLLNCPLDTSHICKLKQFLLRWIHCKISLYLELTWGASRYVYVCQVVQVDDLTLKFDDSTIDSNILEALFLTCHPKAIIVKGRNDLVRFLSKKLIERNGERESWCHKLKEVKLEVYNKTIDPWQPLLAKEKWKKHQWQLRNNHWTKACFTLTWE